MTQEALKLALEALDAMANEGWLLCGPEGLDNAQTKCVEAITAIKEALAQPEPVKWSDYEPDGMHHNKPQKRPQNCGTGYCSCIECVIEPEQKLVADDFFKVIADKNPKPFLLPQRTFVGLAAEDRLTAKYMQDAPDGIEAVIDYIEAKLKELNDHSI